MDDNIEERVRSVVRDVLDVDQEVQVLDASIREQLAPTSLDQMTLFIALEDEFQRSIPQEHIQTIDTLREIIAFIDAKPTA